MELFGLVFIMYFFKLSYGSRLKQYVVAFSKNLSQKAFSNFCNTLYHFSIIFCSILHITHHITHHQRQILFISSKLIYNYLKLFFRLPSSTRIVCARHTRYSKLYKHDSAIKNDKRNDYLKYFLQNFPT